MSHIISSQHFHSGMPLGGIGAGSIELRPDGEFHEWQIHNPEQFSVDSRENPYADKGCGLSGSLSFYLRTEQGGRVLLRRLGQGLGASPDAGREEYNYRMYSFNKPVKAIDYEARFPEATLTYLDDALPVSVELTAASPFTLHAEITAGTPGFYLTFQIRNLSDAPVRTAIASKLKNFLPGNARENTLRSENGRGTLCMEVPGDRDAGSLALTASGGHLTSLPGDYNAYMDTFVSGCAYGVVEESFLYRFRTAGVLPFELPETEAVRTVREPAWHTEEEVAALSDEEIEALIDELRGYGFAQSVISRNEVTVPGLMTTASGRRDLLNAIYRCVRREDVRVSWGSAAIASDFELMPGETQTVTFDLSWYFPRLVSGAGRVVGHAYENRFADALAVSRFMSERRASILEKVHLLSSLLYDTTYPEFFPDAVSQMLSNLIKSAWWTKDENFGVWEGLGSCGFHTTDITYHGSSGLVALFPALQKRQMEMGAAFQRADGRVHHFFMPDFHAVDEGFDRVDMNPQFVLLVCRDFIATGDLGYVKRLWPNITRAIASIELLDADGDGLPEKDARRNTYDSWDFHGTSTYISVLWLASLKAASFLAAHLGEADARAHYDAIYEHGRRTVDEKLFNGSFYDLWTEDGVTDRCCMTDQLDGEYFARLIGLGGILEPDHVHAALDAIYKINYSEENGLINASYPPGETPTVHTYLNCQALANWSGIEYMMACFYLMAGDYAKGCAVTETVQERYFRLGEMFNQAECGSHYYRPLSSWNLMQCLSGMRIMVSERRIEFAETPLREAFRAPWFTAEGCGTVTLENGTYHITCLEGRLEADCIAIGDTMHEVCLRLASGDSAEISAR